MGFEILGPAKLMVREMGFGNGGKCRGGSLGLVQQGILQQSRERRVEWVASESKLKPEEIENERDLRGAEMTEVLVFVTQVV